MGGYKHLIDILKRQDKRAEIGVPLDAFMLISVGELSIRKNHKVVVQALQELPRSCWYLIVGKGELKAELEESDSTGRLRLLGFRTDVVELLHCSDMFVFPSLQEGLPVALMEAMASGIPCVVSNIRGNTDLVSDEMLLFDPNSAQAAYVAISNALSETSVLGTACDTRILMTDFQLTKICEQMHYIYSEL